MNEDRVWYLLSVQLSGEATTEELEELNTLLKQQPSLGLQAEIMRNIWNSRQPRKAKAATTSHFDKHLQRLSNHLAQPALQFETEGTENNVVEMEPVPPRHRVRWLWLAAGVAASVLIFFLVISSGEKKNNKPVAISTRPGSKSKVELPDGTQVWLNADSKLTYGQNFLGNTREVTLTGEAYFDVAHATSVETGQRIPFIIHTNSIDIKVLGTAFNVRSYPGEKTIETALIRGSVEVTLHNSPEKKFILKPDEKLIVTNDNATITGNKPAPRDSSSSGNEPVMTLSKIHRYKADTTAPIETMWVNNKLAFENEAFDRILPEIERWYNVTIVLKNESLKGQHFTGVFDKSLDKTMEALSLSGHFHYNIKGTEVFIW